MLSDLLTHLRATTGRTLVAIAGAPGAGKSTLAQNLANQLGPIAQVIPMDGFHRDNDWLDAHGLRHRKGAPETFDTAGFARCVRGLRDGTRRSFPLFDRAGDCTLPDAGTLSPDARLVLIEGNYLLLERPGWRELAPLWDVTVALDVPLATLRTRLVQRWLDHGLNPTDATARATENDLRNARTVIDHSRAADFILTE